MLEIPAVLSGIKKIITETPLAQRLQEKEIKMHVTEFYYALAGLLNHPKLNSTFNKARVISYNGKFYIYTNNQIYFVYVC